MMPELGKYAAEVLMAYGVSLMLLVGIIAISVWRSRRVKAALMRIEKNG